MGLRRQPGSDTGHGDCDPKAAGTPLAHAYPGRCTSTWMALTYELKPAALAGGRGFAGHQVRDAARRRDKADVISEELRLISAACIARKRTTPIDSYWLPTHDMP